MLEKTGHSVVAVELSPTCLKLVEFFPFEHSVAAVAVEPLDAERWDEDNYLAEQIQAAMERHMRAETADVISSVYAGHTQLRVVEISNDDEDYASTLQWDMEQYLARPLSEYLMDYQAVGPNESETGRLYLVAAYRRSEVERLKRIWESAGFSLAILDVDAFAVINALESAYPDATDGRTFLIKADAHGVLCIRTQGGMFQAYDAMPVDTGLLEVARQVCATFKTAEASWGKIDQIFLCGDLAASSRFCEALEMGLPLPLNLLDAFKETKFLEDIEAGEAIPQGPQCAGVLGLALRRAGDC